MSKAKSQSIPTNIAAPQPEDPRVILRERFGLDQFLEGQQSVIDRLMAGKNVAAVFPTGGGKSLCYQLPSQLLPGTTIVVSPLIALMKDQCDSLAARGIAAARLDSTLSAESFRTVMQGIRDRTIKLLYVAPERFFNERFLASIGQFDVSLFAIDEAHCISQWGHNFRPDYLKLAELAKDLRADRVLALTATATPKVLDDIRQAFHIDVEDAIRTRFFRPNLHLRSCIVESENHYDTLLQRLQTRSRGPTLVYVTQQKTAETLADRLTEDGFPAAGYHAGMDAEKRDKIQQSFIESRDGIVVATIAFGMGIDKSDIRYVYHFNPPKSLESYAQEIGRAGRDGRQSLCELLVLPDDRTVLENFTYGDTPSRRSVGRLIDLISGQLDSFYISHYQLSSETDIRILVVRTLLTYLELDKYLKATSPRYDSYKIKPLVSSNTILQHFDGERRQFVANILATLTKGRTWFSLNTVLAARQLGVERERIIKAVDYMAEQGWLEVKVSDLVHGYRWLRRIEQPKTLADELYGQLANREKNEVARVEEVFALAVSASCQAEVLSNHFGESMDHPCGNCSTCRGETPKLESSPASEDSGATFPRPRSIGSSTRRIIDELSQQYPDRFITARDRARFLCGLSSPSLVRSRLSRHASFGVCANVPFSDVLDQVGGTAD